MQRGWTDGRSNISHRCGRLYRFPLGTALVKRGCNVVGIDNLNEYYDVKLKKDRLKLLSENKNFVFRKLT